jgi:ABC-type antimicrobial peptide transport system permease subunit
MDVKTQDQQIDETLVLERLFVRFTSFSGVLALALACIGLHGTIAYAVNRRTPEIGIRLALGAQRGQVLRMMLRETLLLTGVGVVIGLLLAGAATRLVSSQLFGLKATDVWTAVLAMSILSAVALFAGYLPSRRASRLDPMIALRSE